MDEIKFIATDGCRLSAVSMAMMPGTGDQGNTNKPNEGQFMLVSASGASQSASRILVILDCTPHALKLRNHD